MSETHTEIGHRSGSYRYNPARGGHAPGHLRDAFEEWAYDTDSPSGDAALRQEVVMHNGHMRTLDWLIGRLWNCTDIMPGSLCDQLDLLTGSTYAQGVRSVKEYLTR
jgi:hypothetical protein